MLIGFFIHMTKRLSEGCKFRSLLQILSVDFISNYHHSFGNCEFYHFMNDIFIQKNSGWITRINQYHTFDIVSLFFAFFIGILEFIFIELPSCLFIKIERDNITACQKNTGWVERVFRHWNHNGIFWIGNQ